MTERYGLVLEGGGMRGAYTAGALAWLNDHDITFDYGAGISSGALYLICYLMRDKHIPHKMSTEYVADPEIVGVSAFVKEHHYVAYQHLFHDLVDKENFSIARLKEENPDMEIGCYDLKKGETVWFGPQDLDDGLQLVLAACSLPIASARVKYNGREYLDGGITKMIPIERSIEKGCTKHIVITTKPAGYVRKPGSPAVKVMMKMFYHNYPKMVEDYSIRHLNYNKQMDLIYKLVDEGNAMLFRPSSTLQVARFSGNTPELQELYDLGYQDMENRKEELFRFLGKTE